MDGVDLANCGPSRATLAQVQRQWRWRYGEEGSSTRKGATKKDQILNIFQKEVKSW
jgi:type IV secretory pathway VirB9-like protein